MEEKESKVGNYVSNYSKDSPKKPSFAITPYKDLDIKEASIPTSKVTENIYERPRERYQPQEESVVRPRQAENRPALG